MKTTKYQQIKDISSQTALNATSLDTSLMGSNTPLVSLAFPLIFTESASDRAKETQSTTKQRMQIALLATDATGALIRHEQVADFNQYLKANLAIKQVAIRTVQVSKHGKVQAGKADILVTEGKNLGKKSETTILQQAIQEAQKKYQKFVALKNDQYPHFMLLDLYKYQGSCTNKSNDLKYPQFVQRKYDGLRCGAFIQTSTPILLSRGHKVFTSLTTLETEFTTLFNFIDSDKETLAFLRETCQTPHIQGSANILVDGELYLHGKSLQSLNSIIRNSADSLDKHDILFVAYDVDITLENRSVQLQIPFEIRLQILAKIGQILAKTGGNHINIAPTQTAGSNGELTALFEAFIAQKYEGAVIRSPASLYCYSLNARRSPDSLKYKLKLDMEVAVAGFLSGQGKDANAVIFNCTTNSHSQTPFQVVMNTTYAKRQALFALLTREPRFLDVLKKIPLNIEYAAISDHGLPQQPRGIYFRTENLDFIPPKELLDLLE